MTLGLRYAHWSVAILTFLLLVGVYLVPFPLFENAWYDFKASRYVAIENDRPDRRFAIVDIDERSLEQLGRWPWPRQRIAELLKQLNSRYQVALVGVDILFPDETEADAEFYRDMAGLPITLAQAFQFALPGQSDAGFVRRGKLHSPVSLESQANFSTPKAFGYLGVSTASGRGWPTGHITPKIDVDGKVRKIAPLIQYDGQFYEMLSLSLMRQLYQLPPHYRVEEVGGLRSGMILKNGPIEIPVDDGGFLRIPYRSAPGAQVPYYSAVAVLRGDIPVAELEGRIVVLGSTATGLYDQIATPVAGVFPAAELHTNLLAELMDNHWLSRPHWEQHAIALAIILLVAGGVFLFHSNASITAIAYLAAFGGAWSSFSFYLWSTGYDVRIWPVALCSIGLFVIYLPAMLLYNFTERRKLKNLFSAYVPQTIVEQLLASPDLVVGVSPEKRVLTVMFADVLGFSRIAEALPPESLASYMNRVFDVMTRAVYENGGTVDKYMGDAIMAFWGAPLPDENHAQNAVKAALDLHRELNKLSAEFKLASNPGVEVGVGINTGEMVVGDIGSSYRHTYTVIGDSVNQAARLQELTRQHKLPILLGQETVALLPAGAYESQLRSLGLMPMQGRKEPVMIFALQVGKNVKE